MDNKYYLVVQGCELKNCSSILHFYLYFDNPSMNDLDDGALEAYKTYLKLVECDPSITEKDIHIDFLDFYEDGDPVIVKQITLDEFLAPII